MKSSYHAGQQRSKRSKGNRTKVQRSLFSLFSSLYRANRNLTAPESVRQIPDTMAQVAAMRQLYQRLGFSEPATNAILTGQNILSLEDIRELDESRCSNLCKNLRRPGGTIPNLAAQGPNPPPGIQENIPNPGLAVSESAEFNLQLAVYFLRHQQRVSRPVPIGSVTLNAVRALRVTREAEEKHKNPTVLPKIDPKDWPKTIDGIQDYLRRYLGSTGIPLGYVTRQHIREPKSMNLEIISKAFLQMPLPV